jgi:putative oxidoreductase
MRFGIAVLRALIGCLFVGHGLQKLTGSFGGDGLEATGQAFEGMGLRPGKAQAAAAGAAEAGGGALLVVGLLTPVASAAVTGAMAMAIHTVHAGKGPWATQGGWEYNAVVVASVFAITAAGPGALSVDEGFGTDRSGLGTAFASTAAGLGGAALARLLSDRQPEPQA